MNTFDIVKSFPTDEACLEYLREIRCHGHPFCPHCGSVNVSRENRFPINTDVEQSFRSNAMDV